MIEKGIGKTIYHFIFGTTADECKELKTLWFTKCFEQPRLHQQAFVWPTLGDEKADVCKKLYTQYEQCKNNLKT